MSDALYKDTSSKNFYTWNVQFWKQDAATKVTPFNNIQHLPKISKSYKFESMAYTMGQNFA